MNFSSNNFQTLSDKQDLFDKYHSNCLKGIAIIMLIAHHCFLRPSRYKGADLVFVLPEPVWNYVCGFFKICVCLFAFISAYGLTRKMMTLSSDASSYDRRTFIFQTVSSRIIRLLGSFIFVFLLADLFSLFYDPGRLAEIYGTSFPLNVQYFLIDMLGLAELFQTPTFLGTYWYYSLALILIFLIPVFYLLLQRIGALAFTGLIAAVNFTLTFQNPNIRHYILCIAIGTVCASGNIITRLVHLQICKKPFTNRLFKFIIEFLILFILMICREGALKSTLEPFWDAVIPVAVTVFCCEFLFSVPGIRQILNFLGIHSANIFLVHNFMRKVWFHDFIYSFRYPLCIVTVLLMLSLLLSLCIELLKKLLHYNQFITRIVQLVTRK